MTRSNSFGVSGERAFGALYVRDQRDIDHDRTASDAMEHFVDVTQGGDRFATRTSPLDRVNRMSRTRRSARSCPRCRPISVHLQAVARRHFLNDQVTRIVAAPFALLLRRAGARRRSHRSRARPAPSLVVLAQRGALPVDFARGVGEFRHDARHLHRCAARQVRRRAASRAPDSADRRRCPPLNRCDPPALLRVRALRARRRSTDARSTR